MEKLVSDFNEENNVNLLADSAVAVGPAILKDLGAAQPAAHFDFSAKLSELIFALSSFGRSEA